MYGKLTFIKKTGGDGSKYPVTVRDISIGRSDDCLIKIQNPLIDLKHCHIVVDDNDQVKLKNLSSQTFLNDKLLTVGDFALCHGDIFQIGDRAIRWEYHTSSKYYQNRLSSNGRLVAVVPPQQRAMNEIMTPESSTSQISPAKKCVSDIKKRFSEKIAIEDVSSKKIEVNSASKIYASSGSSTPKIHSLRRSLMLTKRIFSPNNRKSLPGSNKNGTPKSKTVENMEKRSLTPWDVKSITPPSEAKIGRRKDTPIKKTSVVNSPKRFKKSLRLSLSGVLKVSNLNTITEFSPKENNEIRRSTKNLNIKTSSNTSEECSTNLFTTPKKKFSKGNNLTQSENRSSSGKFNDDELKKIKLNKVNTLSKSVEKRSKSPMFSKRRKTISDTSNLLCEKFNEEDKVECWSKSIKNENFTSQSLNSPSNVKKSLDRFPVVSLIDINDGLNSPSGEKRLMKPETDESISTSKEAEGLLPTEKSLLLTSKNNEQSPVKESCKTSTTISVKKTVSNPVSINKSKQKRNNPSKIDKSKKVSLLVLRKGKNQNLPISHQNKLKNKIVKKAIKNSTVAKEDKKRILKEINNKREEENSTNLFKSGDILKGGNKFLESLTQTPKNKSGRKSKIHTLANETPKSCTKMHNSRRDFEGNLLKEGNENFDIASEIIFDENDVLLFNSKRRSSKRLFSKNGNNQLDFVELSPKALGLIPKNLDNYPRSSKIKNKRRSISLTTPKKNCTRALVKSASTTKVVKKRSLKNSPDDRRSFSSKNASNSSLQILSIDLDNLSTPNISLDAFVSPLKSSTNSVTNDSETNRNDDDDDDVFEKSSNKENLKTPKSTTRIKSARKILQTPEINKFSQNTNSNVKTEKIMNFSEKKEKLKQTASKTDEKYRRQNQVVTPSIKKNLFKTLSQDGNALKTPDNERLEEKTLNTSVSTPGRKRKFEKLMDDAQEMEKETRTKKISRTCKSPKNDLSDVKGVKQIFRSPKVQKSPKNDLSDVKGVKQIFRSPRVQKSPKNDLSDVKGVKQIFRSPKVQKSPKNDLSDVKGVKQIFRSPKVQKSPKNDLSDVKGVKQIFRSPRVQKSPKNDLSDVKGVKQIFRSPRVQRSPKNDLSDVKGVKQIFRSPLVQKSPKNDLSDVKGVKQMFKSPRVQKSPKNELNNFEGVPELFASPCSSANELEKKNLLLSSVDKSNGFLNSNSMDLGNHTHDSPKTNSRVTETENTFSHDKRKSNSNVEEIFLDGEETGRKKQKAVESSRISKENLTEIKDVQNSVDENKSSDNKYFDFNPDVQSLDIPVGSGKKRSRMNSNNDLEESVNKNAEIVIKSVTSGKRGRPRKIVEKPEIKSSEDPDNNDSYQQKLPTDDVSPKSKLRGRRKKELDIEFEGRQLRSRSVLSSNQPSTPNLRKRKVNVDDDASSGTGTIVATKKKTSAEENVKKSSSTKTRKEVQVKGSKSKETSGLAKTTKKKKIDVENSSFSESETKTGNVEKKPRVKKLKNSPKISPRLTRNRVAGKN
ncbi:golgin IMH1, putative [Pediculus humanus corporis]|uniref:Golgin IMH1, putative n=1 Tax=Pediculus humanus subsp. corporis TaxID=121224 RepID=E0VA11_PEDHC|nr:golgin IMH1, putative [Pediculus humanus corporis]EEB10217.1 golgin IMH1, putative [Pediculus humanus corporis]